MAGARGATGSIRKAACSAVAISLCFGSTAAAQDPAVDQYVERVPTARGDTPPRPSKGTGSVPPEVARRIERDGGRDAAALRAIAGSPGLGAPKPRANRPRHRAGDEDEGRSAIGAAVGAVEGDGGAPLGWLLAGLIASAAAAGAVALSRRRAR